MNGRDKIIAIRERQKEQSEKSEQLAKWIREYGFDAVVRANGTIKVSLINRAITCAEVRTACHFNDTLPMRQLIKSVLIEDAS